jgi:hypothetical protein
MNMWNPPDWHSIEAIGTWVAAIGTIGAVWVALFLARRDTKSGRIERRGEIIAMCADMYHARHCMETLVREQIQAPLYRIPDSTFASGLTKLIGDGRLRENEIAVLQKYADIVAEINRGLTAPGLRTWPLSIGRRRFLSLRSLRGLLPLAKVLTTIRQFVRDSQKKVVVDDKINRMPPDVSPHIVLMRD